MRPLKVFGILTAIGTLGYMAFRWMRRGRITRIPVEEIR